MSAVVLPSSGITWARVRAARILSHVGKGFVGAALLMSYAWTLFPHVEIGRGIGAFGWLLAVVMFVTSFVVWFARGSMPGSVALDGETLRVVRGPKTRAIPRARIANAFVVERLVGRVFVPTVEIELADGDVITTRLESLERANELVDALGFGRGGKSVTIDTGAASRRLFHVLYGIGAYYAGAILAFVPLIVLMMARHDFSEPRWWTGLLVAPATLLGYRFIRKRARAPRLTIGDDGLVYETGRKREVIPRADIVSITQNQPGNAVFIETRTRPFPITIGGSGIDLERRAAAGRLAFGRFFGFDAPAPNERATAFERGSRTVGEWREHLRGLFGQTNYRVATATVDDASAVLRSPLASPEQRIGAAIALRVSGEPPAKIRIAAEAAVDTDVREALDAIAEGESDESAIEKALRRAP